MKRNNGLSSPGLLALDLRQSDSYLLLVIYRIIILFNFGERTGLVARASDSGSGDPGSILGRVGVLFP